MKNPAEHRRARIAELRSALIRAHPDHGGTAAIWWRQRAIPTLIEYTKPANTPVDILLEQKVLPKLKVLTVLPELVSQLTLQGKMSSEVHA